MPRTEEQNQQIREATRTAIVQGAMTLFAQHGYAHTSTRRIAEQAGVSTGLMYHYFSSKEDLLHAVFDHCMGILGSAFAASQQSADPVERIASLLRTMFDLLERDPEFWGLFYMLRTQPAILNELGDAFRQWTARLRDLLTDNLRGAGRADPEIDALLLYSLIEGTIQQYLLDPAHYPLAVVASRIIEEFGTRT